jgi:hypothetical protein
MPLHAVTRSGVTRGFETSRSYGHASTGRQGCRQRHPRGSARYSRESGPAIERDLTPEELRS